MATFTAKRFTAGQIVTHLFSDEEYVVISSGGHYTQVVTNDEDAVDISFPTEDLTAKDV